MEEVESMFSASLVAVPDFIRVEPDTGSGPTSSDTRIEASLAFSRGLQVTSTVTAPAFLPAARPPCTYGVIPLAAIPMTVSPRRARREISFSPFPKTSSAPSLEWKTASWPPAIRAVKVSGDTP